MIFGREPVLILEAVRSALLVAIAFGLHLADGQVAVVMVAVSAILSVVVRQRVSPAASVPSDPAV